MVCLRPATTFAEQDWRTQLRTITVDALPPPEPDAPLMGNIIFFPRADTTFLPSVLAWLDALSGEARAPLHAYEQD